MVQNLLWLFGWKKRMIMILFFLGWKSRPQSEGWGFHPRGDGVLRCQGRLCVPDVDDMREYMIVKGYSSQYSI